MLIVMKLIVNLLSTQYPCTGHAHGAVLLSKGHTNIIMKPGNIYWKGKVPQKKTQNIRVADDDGHAPVPVHLK